MMNNGDEMDTIDQNDDTRLPLQGHPGLEEEKTLNTTVPFHRNIRHDEYEYAPSENSSASAHRQGLNSTLYGFKLKTLCTVVVTAIVFSILAMGLSIYAIVKYTDAARELQTARENRGKVCLPCDDMVIQLDSWKERNVAGDCCVRLEEVLSMMDKIAEQRATDKMQAVQETMLAKFVNPPTNKTSSGFQQRVSAHIALSNIIDTKGTRLAWTGEDQFGHITSGLQLVDTNLGKIKVFTAGYYFLYSLMTINIDEVDGSNPPPTYSHEIKVLNPDAPKDQPFIQSHNMRWKNVADRSYNQQTSYVGGTIFLPSQAIVYVHTTDKRFHTSCTYARCYFGLYKL